MTNSTTNEPEPSDSLKTFGLVHKAFRKRAGLTQEEFAPLVRYQPSTVASIEQGRRLPPRVYVERAEEVLDAFGVLRAAAKYATRQPGLASWFRKWADLEEQAISLYTFENRLVPGLLQTEEYSRTLFNERVPVLTDSQIEAQLAARAERQRLLAERPNTVFNFIVEEHVIRRGTGGTQVTRELIDHILTVTELRNVELQLMPMARSVHAGLDGPIRLLETPENEWFGYCEGQRNGQFIADPETISVLHMRYAKLRSQALTPDDSRSLMERTRGAL
ncbi:helix-turn-helix transcriptional regulator [Streptomyces phaeochromogenes]|uniref:Helix-turn-helix transcriptional regulator n=1 Tax=Streptomyces phaeochromogenes TaxID=1923 RepID=A0ABZ1H8Q8_STRPH|nr:helix-turn-helix transcriptional regulator [Streptomyces phaeochromogenes]MCX5600671.1 helix-turn-helix transcriptional regulator [Streptomyces phaeochromogenes]WSD13983.1 helix-turn-helix transcriptional regulator [Streptomyces phaeochromogenes]